jgi:hypothetical protein
MNMERMKCAWCMKPINKRKDNLNIGSECRRHIPDRIKVAILNKGTHSCEYMQEWGFNEEQHMEKVIARFGNSVDYYIWVECIPYYNDVTGSCIHRGITIMNQDGKVLTMHIDEWSGLIEDDEIQESWKDFIYSADRYYDECIAIMSETAEREIRWLLEIVREGSETEVEVVHIDHPAMSVLAQGNQYLGPICYKENFEKGITNNGWTPNAWAPCSCATVEEHWPNEETYAELQESGTILKSIQHGLGRLASFSQTGRLEQLLENAVVLNEKDIELSWHDDLRRAPWMGKPMCNVVDLLPLISYSREMYPWLSDELMGEEGWEHEWAPKIVKLAMRIQMEHNLDSFYDENWKRIDEKGGILRHWMEMKMPIPDLREIF